MTITLDLAGVVNFDMDYTDPNTPVISPPVAATATSHATITGTYAGADIIIRPSLTATWERAEHYHEGDTTIVADSSGTWDAADMDNFGNGPLSLEIRFYPELPGWVFDNDWHNSVMMAYADDYRPDANGAAGDCVTNAPCLQINGLAGTNNDKVSVLILAGEHDWVDVNDPSDVFNIENSNSDSVFDIRTVDGTVTPGEDFQLDKILVIN